MNRRFSEKLSFMPPGTAIILSDVGVEQCDNVTAAISLGFSLRGEP